MTRLTIRQREILSLIEGHIESTGAPPTRAEIAKKMGFRSPNAAEDHLRALSKKGYIQLVPGTSRGIRLAEKNPGLPVVGYVAAGSPILAKENIDDFRKIDSNNFNPPANYLLKVKGNSMIDAGIYDGDLLAVHSQPQAEQGEIVVARIDDEVTVKKYYRDSEVSVTLKAENSEFSDINVNLPSQDFAIEGIGVGVIRNF